jgi:predicted HAD superfamily Cof-like phosphohydrolase
MSTVDMVRDFHMAFQVPPRDFAKAEDREFRLRLLTEEFKEVAEALGFFAFVNVVPVEERIPNRENFLKELCDLKYVTDGAAIAFDMDMDRAFVRVHDSNMSKLDDNGQPIFREDGKVLKSENYEEPDLGDLV